MTLIDTSVWIDYFNGNDTDEANQLDTLLYDGEAAIGDLIFLEILQGFRSDQQYETVRQKLAKLDRYELFGDAMVLPCAQNYRTLRKLGITIRKTPDVIIATYCIENSVPLLFSDRDFRPFVQHLGLIDAGASET
ncbi:type II toxin-antitoxin system VapC family toxin [Acaryochloris marina NIES-2412]|uniref:type II toxin-antitoxin system VapC family toxin n=1 Tax=Acaryochloris marina TaxID=155978 RepID=UPI00405A0181